MTAVDVAFAAMSVLLVGAGLTLLYPAITGVQVVVYRKAVVALGVSTVLFVVGWLVSDLAYYGFVDANVVYVVASLVVTAASVLHLAAIWLFARDFVQFEADSIPVDVSTGDTEGFENE